MAMSNVLANYFLYPFRHFFRQVVHASFLLSGFLKNHFSALPKSTEGRKRHCLFFEKLLTVSPA